MKPKFTGRYPANLCKFCLLGFDVDIRILADELDEKINLFLSGKTFFSAARWEFVAVRTLGFNHSVKPNP